MNGMLALCVLSSSKVYGALSIITSLFIYLFFFLLSTKAMPGMDAMRNVSLKT